MRQIISEQTYTKVIVMYGDYLPFQLGDIPNYGNDIYANGFEATGEVINIANALPGHQPTYASIFAGIDYDNYHTPYFGIFITDSNTMDNPFVNAGVVMQHNVYGPYTSLNIPKKIVSGILDALKYIFIPDINKVKEVFNTVKNKFGVEPPTNFTLTSEELNRPDNVIWKFHPISLNGEPTDAVDITLINFEMVDEWLDSSPGRVITRILQAMFGITMFAYLIYIFTKHIATVNYTDAHTLMHLDDPPKGGKGP